MNFNIEYKKKIDTMINCYINSSENWDLLLSKELDEFLKSTNKIFGEGTVTRIGDKTRVKIGGFFGVSRDEF